MSLEAALKLIERGFRVFPLAEGGKLPAISDFPSAATSKKELCEIWWRDFLLGTEKDFNVGIAMSWDADGHYLIGVDVDNKQGRRGDEDLEALALIEGKTLPETFEQKTPSGGRHLVYRSPLKVGNSSKDVAPGVDIRGWGGYLVGAGSRIGDKVYEANWKPVAMAPDWLVDACAPLRDIPNQVITETGGSRAQSLPGSVGRAQAYVRTVLGVPEGARGITVYKMAARIRDMGVAIDDAKEVIRPWVDRCQPPMPLEEMLVAVDNAYTYAKNQPGKDSPEASFKDILPQDDQGVVDYFNERCGLIHVGTKLFVLEADTRAEDGYSLYNPADYMIKTAHYTVERMIGKKPMHIPAAKIWMKSKNRRFYRGFCMRPEGADSDFFNLWQGFSVEPAPRGVENEAVDALLDHIKTNICLGNEDYARWVTGWFAQMIQAPHEKPRTALVLQGGKGVGKNFLLDRIGQLISRHYLVTASRRYLTGNFNAYLERCLLLVLDEAFWSGDKQAEGILKNLITERTHVVEAKGIEPRRVRSLTRVCIIGNEEWLVPATKDERRYAVFSAGNARRNDLGYFRKIYKGLERGGYPVLLRKLLDYDLSKVDVDSAPETEFLENQKLCRPDDNPMKPWWEECLEAGEIVGGVTLGWPPSDQPLQLLELYNAFLSWAKDRSVRFPPTFRYFAHHFQKTAWVSEPFRTRSEGNRYWVRTLGTLEACRKKHELES